MRKVWAGKCEVRVCVGPWHDARIRSQLAHRPRQSTTLRQMQPLPNDQVKSRDQARIALLCLLVCLCILLLDRWLVLHQFGFRYVDDDQAIMWTGALEMAQGRFHEPCFYGQRYNTMLEGLLAVPLLWMGVGPSVALPLITSSLTLFPFLLLAFFLFKQRAHALAAIVLVLPVTLPPEYGMITSMPRGFVTGVFLSAFAILPLYWRHPATFFLSPFFTILAVFANPNAVLVLAPVGLLILLRHYADLRLYGWGLMGAVPAGLIYFFALRFYDLHPAYAVHAQWELGFHVGDIRRDHLRFLDELSPVLWGKGFMVSLVLSVLLIMLCIARQWKSAIALFGGIFLLVASFGFGKVHDGIPSVFYPWARMFLAVPFLIALFAAQLKWTPRPWVMMVMPLVAAGFFAFKCVEQPAAVERQIDTLKLNYMEAMEVDELKRHCVRVERVAQQHQSHLLVVSRGYKKHLTTYGCPCLLPDFPTTMEPHLDRRTWWLQAVAPQVATNILFSGIPERHFRDLPLPFAGAKLVSQEPELFLLKGNAERTDSMLVHIRIGMREHRVTRFR